MWKFIKASLMTLTSKKTTAPTAPRTEIDAFDQQFLDELLELLILAPKSEIDPRMVRELQVVKESPVPARGPLLKNVLDQCAHGALASNFAMMNLDLLWKGYSDGH